MGNESESYVSPREAYKNLQKEVNENKAKNDPVISDAADEAIDELDQIGEELEKKELDKNMGTKKVEMTFTKEDNDRRKQKEFDKSTAAKINSIAGMRASKLDPKDQTLMKKILEAFESGKIKDNLLLHLVKRKIGLHQEVETQQSKAKKLQLKLLNELATLTDAVVKSQGALEVFNKDILVYTKENPKLIK